MTVIEREIVEVVAPAEVTAADVLNRAADLLEEFGWQQVVRGSKRSGIMCAVGAVGEAFRDFGAPLDRAYYFGEGVEVALKSVGIRDSDGLWIFNDADGRTKAEVVAKLREAAKAAA